MAHQPRWTMSQVTELFNKPLLDLLFEAQQIHRQHFDPRQVQVSTLLSIKTGACPEDCKYCPQSARYKTGLEAERLMEVEQVLESARQAKNAGSTRFCMGAAWKNPNDRDMPYLEQMVKGVKALGLESCMTLGTLTDSQAQRLAEAGLDYYNHSCSGCCRQAPPAMPLTARYGICRPGAKAKPWPSCWAWRCLTG